MSVLDPPRSDPETSTAVVAAAVIVHESTQPDGALEALKRQAYAPASVAVVAQGQRLDGFLEELAPDVTHVWLVHADASPRPDALAALVEESRRVGAAVAGSKILHADRPEVLESVGFSTDVFEVPYTGLDRDEVDQQQYDVVRDVAFVGGASVLIERNLLTALGGIDTALAPQAAALDLCQRARLFGARVMVIPSSEVMHAGSCHPKRKRWREDAGRLRSMLKAYGVITLLWVVPMSFLLGILDSVLAPFFGRWRLFDFVRSWAWNVARLITTLQARRRVGHVDEELFRYQVTGSVMLRRYFGVVSERFHRSAESGIAHNISERLVEHEEGSRAQRPLVAFAVAVAFALVAVRHLVFSGMPGTGYALPFPESATAALRSFAGGWNVAGLGSPEPLRPGVAAAALVQLVALGKAGAGAALLSVITAVGGVLGTARLLRRWDIGPVPRYAAGVGLIAGPAAAAIARSGSFPGLVAVAVLPWAVAALISKPRGVYGWTAAVAAGAVTIGVAAAFVPPMLVVPAGAAVVWALIRREGRTALVALVATAAAVPLLVPWIGAVDLGSVLAAGRDAYWTPSLLVLIPFAVTVGAVILVGRSPHTELAGWAALLGGAGFGVARLGSAGAGYEIQVTGQALAALGVGVAIGAAWDSFRRPSEGAWTAAGTTIGAAAALVLLAVAGGVLATGRLGLPAPTLIDTLDFTEDVVADEPARILVIGPADEVPGDSRRLSNGDHYRVMSAPFPELWEAWLPEARLGDGRLAGVVESITAGEVFRGGAELAPFGIRWIVLMGPEPASQLAFDAQIDLISLGVAAEPVYEVETPIPRAVAADGAAWAWDPPDYRGDPAAAVRIAENADARWTPPPWEQEDWANLVAGSEGLLRFGPIGSLQWAAWAAGAYLLIAIVAALAARERS